jgi:phosphoenolpyruvate carboxykinase (GTP)
VVPLVNEARDWQHGTFLGSIISSEKTAAAAGKIGELRRDPMAMLPFCGYNMGDYWAHWLRIGKRKGAKLPKLFYVNWFRKGEDGDFLWPGYSENSRVLKWIFERVAGTAQAVPSPIGNLPAPGAIDVSGLKIPDADMAALQRVDVEGWIAELPVIRAHLAKFGSKLPAALHEEFLALEHRLQAAAVAAGR